MGRETVLRYRKGKVGVTADPGGAQHQERSLVRQKLGKTLGGRSSQSACVRQDLQGDDGLGSPGDEQVTAKSKRQAWGVLDEGNSMSHLDGPRCWLYVVSGGVCEAVSR